jgi:Putative Ig domain
MFPYQAKADTPKISHRRSTLLDATLSMRFALTLFVAMSLAVVEPTSDSFAVRIADAPCPESGPGGSRICPTGAVGKLYSIRLDGEGGCGLDPNVPGSGLPYQFRVLNGQPPPGLSLRKDGLLSGVPTKVGTWAFWIELSDEDPPSATWCRPEKSEREFSIQVAAPAATVGTPYAVGVAVAGVGAQMWSIASGTLPRGLVLNQAAGTITGTPSITGSFPLTLVAIDSEGRTATVPLTVVVYPKLVMTTRRLSALKVGQSYRSTIRTSGGVGRVRLRVRSGRFPVGIRLNTDTGVLGGKPRKAGAYRVTIEAHDGMGRTASQTYVLTVRASGSH